MKGRKLTLVILGVLLVVGAGILLYGFFAPKDDASSVSTPDGNQSTVGSSSDDSSEEVMDYPTLEPDPEKQPIFQKTDESGNVIRTLSVRKDDAEAELGDAEVQVEDGMTYVIRLEVENFHEGTVSTNTRVAFDIPDQPALNLNITGSIFSDNTEERQYKQSVMFSSDKPFVLTLVSRTAQTVNENGNFALDDAITQVTETHGVPLGTKIMDGKIPAGSAGKNVVEICVKASLAGK